MTMTFIYKLKSHETLFKVKLEQPVSDNKLVPLHGSVEALLRLQTVKVLWGFKSENNQAAVKAFSC